MFVLAALRAIWRLIIPGPVNDADRLGWQTVAAYVTHILFYICFFGLPLSGWAMWSALGGGELSVAGIVPWPQMPFGEIERPLLWWILDWAEGLHALLIILLVAILEPKPYNPQRTRIGAGHLPTVALLTSGG